jgi:hypothetical protein
MSNRPGDPPRMRQTKWKSRHREQCPVLRVYKCRRVVIVRSYEEKVDHTGPIAVHLVCRAALVLPNLLLLYRSEEATMQPIQQSTRQACRATAPGSPLNALQHLPLYRDSPIKALDDAITLLFAGQVTSAATLSWTLYLLRAPTCAAKAGRKAATMLLIFLQHQRYPQETVAATQHGVLGRGRQGIYATVPGRSIRAPPT